MKKHMNGKGPGSRTVFLLLLVSGKPDDGGAAYVLHGTAGAGLRDELDGSKQEHIGGSGRRGLPDLCLDPAGNLHLTYGAQYAVFYNSCTFEGTAMRAPTGASAAAAALSPDRLVKATEFNGSRTWRGTE